jgi:tellurite resistance protein TerC
VVSLFARTGFIFLGAALINSFAWVFYIFGLILLVTAGNLLKPESEESHTADNFIIRIARRLFHTSDQYDGDKLFTIVDGRKVMTPMLLVMVAIGGTDLLFALDSIPAIFGLTQNVYIVFTATAFSLLGLRQLYFLINGLLDRLIYLSYGLAAILAFIGVKLILHALHENTIPFINGGEHVDVYEVTVAQSLVVIVGVLAFTIIASLLSKDGKAQHTASQLKHHATDYLELDGATPAERSALYAQLTAAEYRLHSMPEKYRAKHQDHELSRLVHEAHMLHRAHAGHLAPGP